MNTKKAQKVFLIFLVISAFIFWSIGLFTVGYRLGHEVGYQEGYECGAVDAYVFLMTPNIEMAERAGYQSSTEDLLPPRPDYCHD